MSTNDQTKTPSMMQHTLRTAAIAAASVALGITAASAQTTPTQPAPPPAAVTPPATPAAAPARRAASQYETVFKRIDGNNDGSITKSELEKADGKLGADFQKYDTDGDGKLSMPEFEAMMKSMQG